MTEQIPFNITPLPLKLRVEDYLLLDGAGAFADYAKTELIDGEILFMNAQHRPHARLKTELGFLLRSALQSMHGKLALLIEPSITMPPHSVPEPDIVLTSEPDGSGPVPLPSVALLVEIADATLAGDLGRKAGLYARHRVPEYWVVDVNGRVVHQFWSPRDGTYGERRQILIGGALAAVTIPELTVDTATL